MIMVQFHHFSLGSNSVLLSKGKMLSFSSASRSSRELYGWMSLLCLVSFVTDMVLITFYVPRCPQANSFIYPIHINVRQVLCVCVCVSKCSHNELFAHFFHSSPAEVNALENLFPVSHSSPKLTAEMIISTSGTFGTQSGCFCPLSHS